MRSAPPAERRQGKLANSVADHSSGDRYPALRVPSGDDLRALSLGDDVPAEMVGHAYRCRPSGFVLGHAGLVGEHPDRMCPGPQSSQAHGVVVAVVGVVGGIRGDDLLDGRHVVDGELQAPLERATGGQIIGIATLRCPAARKLCGWMVPRSRNHQAAPTVVTGERQFDRR